ncbi:S8 family peptidase [Actinoplanes sp. NPDC051513]|uniref:S8 family peptidase n=1 Tax=Actinoplanes sp. NPDC051513 TaxID=3363908 RepID=UPI0037A2D6CD
MSRRHHGYVVVTLRAGETAPRMPAQLDVLVGAARAADRITGGRLDRTVRGLAGGFRATAVYHARRNLGRVGARGLAYDDVEHELGLSRTYRLQLAEAGRADRVVDALRALPVVESATVEPLATTGSVAVIARPEPDEIVAPYDFVRAREALQSEPGDERVTVAVVDTGVSLGHAELQRKLLSGYDVVDFGLGGLDEQTVLVGDSRGRDFAPTDDVGHGSHVAGVIGAQGWRLPRGVGGRCRVLPIRVLAAATHAGAGPDAERFGVGAITEINLGLKVAADLGADVLNLSFGTPESALDPYAPPPHEAIISYATRAGCVLVAAAGNAGSTEAYHPAVDPRVIAVGSVSPTGARSSFSSYGDHIALSAPGERVIGVGRHSYRRATGTSHAAPFVTGACALLVSRARAAGASAGPERVRSWLTGGARRSHAPPREVGAGVLDVVGALARCDADLSADNTWSPR